MITEIGQWYGKNVEELSRRELLDVIKHLVNELESLKENKNI